MDFTKFDENCWGLSTSIDVYDVNHELITDPDYLYEWVLSLVDEIDMKRYGEPIIVRFGNGINLEGYSVVQLIETSCITAHFDEFNNVAYIDVFSCAPYNPKKAAKFCMDFLDGNNYNMHYIFRK
jgi:S-adenosylmethionine/arginine decarboxylase-like enzyme